MSRCRHVQKVGSFPADALLPHGCTTGAASLLIDVDVLVLAMKRMGQLWSYGIDLADDLFQEDGELHTTAQRQHGGRSASGI